MLLVAPAAHVVPAVVLLYAADDGVAAAVSVVVETQARAESAHAPGAVSVSLEVRGIIFCNYAFDDPILEGFPVGIVLGEGSLAGGVYVDRDGKVIQPACVVPAAAVVAEARQG
jgi:hypothetical protein